MASAALVSALACASCDAADRVDAVDAATVPGDPDAIGRAVAYHLAIVGAADLPAGVELDLGGRPGTELATELASPAALADASFTAELRVGATVVARFVDRPADHVLGAPELGAVTSITTHACALTDGELRLGHIAVRHEQAAYDLHAFCGPPCEPRFDNPYRYCPTGEACTSAIVVTEPMLAPLRCAIVGAGAAGDACTWTPAADGALVGDCAAGLHCLAGTCTPTCWPGASPDACPLPTTCTTLAGHAPELGVCQLPP